MMNEAKPRGKGRQTSHLYHHIHDESYFPLYQPACKPEGPATEIRNLIWKQADDQPGWSHRCVSCPWPSGGVLNLMEARITQGDLTT